MKSCLVAALSNDFVITESTRKKEEVGPSEGNIEEFTSPKANTKKHVLPVGRLTTRGVSFKRLNI